MPRQALRSAPNAIFTEGVVKASGICSAAAGKFLVKPQGLRERSLPLGGAVAQRLRGYEWRSEKSVKAIAPTGAALAFLCFDFFFRIVKGVQPLACCGVGGVQRYGGGSRNTPPCLWPSGASLHAEGRQNVAPQSATLFWFSFGVKREHLSATSSSPSPVPYGTIHFSAAAVGMRTVYSM